MRKFLHERLAADAALEHTTYRITGKRRGGMSETTISIKAPTAEKTIPCHQKPSSGEGKE